jgi:hypothetical protein
MRERGKTLTEKRKEMNSDIFAVMGDLMFSRLYNLTAEANRTIEKAMTPVKEWERREKKEKANIRNVFL